ncbi:MAG: hypothetical protein HYZ83_05915 [Candidatus Omnitrophica bacterium]|nr:hypothetical protein [Candidatus Omnitrophota bacterium]
MKKGNEGFILVTSYIMITVISIFSLALFSRHNIFIQAAERNHNRIIAFQAAEAGIDQAISSLETDFNYTGQTYTAVGNTGGYSVVVSLPPNQNPAVRQIVADGFAPGTDATARAYETREIRTYVQILPRSVFEQAIFSNNELDMSGFTVVDSYDSRNAPYDPANPGSNGNMRTNSILSGAVHLQGGDLTYRGSIFVGPNGNPDEVVVKTGAVNVTGTISASSELMNFPAPEIPPISSSGTLSLSGQTNYTIAGGTYVYDAIDIKGNATLTITGPVKIFVTGDFKISGLGNVAVDSNKASNFIVNMAGGGAVDFSSNSLAFYGALYAPDSSVQLSNTAVVHGAIVADNFKQSGHSEFHYDEALSDLDIGVNVGNQVQVISWQENLTGEDYS